MGTAFLYGNGGGIDNLKFRVYSATSLPSSGKENDVCIITSTPISSWEAGAVDNPTWSMDSGFVYLTCDASDASQPNLLRKNALYLKLMRCWQYEKGTWSTKDAYQFRNGAWVQFSSAFTATINITYPAGSTCTATDGVTTLTAPDTSGTWACVVPNAGTWKISVAGYAPEKSVSITHSGQIVNVVYYTLYSLGDTNTGIDAIGWIYKAEQIPLSPTVAHNNDGLTITLGGKSDGGYNGVAYFPKINLTGFRTISVDISTNNVNTSFGDAYIIGVWSKVGSGYYPSTAAAKKNITNGTKTITLDVTSLNGDYYIGFGIRKDAPTSVYKITRVQLS